MSKKQQTNQWTGSTDSNKSVNVGQGGVPGEKFGSGSSRASTGGARGESGSTSSTNMGDYPFNKSTEGQGQEKNRQQSSSSKGEGTTDRVASGAMSSGPGVTGTGLVSGEETFKKGQSGTAGGKVDQGVNKQAEERKGKTMENK